MTPLLDDAFLKRNPPESDAKVFSGAFQGRKEKAPQDYKLDEIARYASIDALTGKQLTCYLVGGYQANGELICAIMNDKNIVYLVLRSYENDLVRYYYVNPTSITCLSFVDRERKTLKTEEERAQTSIFHTNRDLGDEAYQAEAHPI